VHRRVGAVVSARAVLLPASRAAGIGVLAAGLNLAVAAGLVWRSSLAAVAIAVCAVLAAAAVGKVSPSILVYAALGTTLLVPWIGRSIPGTGSVQIFPADLIVVGALAVAWVRSTRIEGRVPIRFPAALAIPLLLLVPGIVLGVLRGNSRYGESVIGQPFRILFYAAVAAVVAGIAAQSFYRGLVAVFYAGTVLEAVIGALYLVTGRSQTNQVDLSTGGTRALALGSAIYLCGALILALMNLEHDRSAGGRVAHLVIAGLAIFGIVIAEGRTNFIALGLILPVLFLARRRILGVLASYLPLVAPLVAVAVIVLSFAAPKLGSSLFDRVANTSSSDINVVWRRDAVAATMNGFGSDELRGVGFGRSVSFTLRNEQRQYVTYTINGDPHNSYVWLLAGGGLLTLVPFIVLCLAFIADTLRRLRYLEGIPRLLATWALAFWVVFVVNAFAGPVLTRADFLLTIWTLMLIPAAVSPSGRLAHAERPWREPARADLIEA
jgi:hypothetical protein